MAYSAQPQINSHKTDYFSFGKPVTQIPWRTFIGGAANTFRTRNLIPYKDEDGKVYLKQRPCLVSSNPFPAFPFSLQNIGRNFLVLDQFSKFLFYSIFDGVNWRVYAASSSGHTLITTAGPTSTNIDFAPFTFISGQVGVFITGLPSGNSGFYNISTSTFTGGLAPGLNLTNPVSIDNFVFANRNLTNDIQQCNFDNPLVWTAGDFITADLNPGLILRLKRVKNYIAVFKTQGVEFLFNAGNPSGSVLAQYESFFCRLDIGDSPNISPPQYGLQVIEYQDKLLFTANGSFNKPGIYSIDPTGLELLTTAPIFADNSAGLTFLSGPLAIIEITGRPFLSFGFNLPLNFMDLQSKEFVSFVDFNGNPLRFRFSFSSFNNISYFFWEPGSFPPNAPTTSLNVFSTAGDPRDYGINTITSIISTGMLNHDTTYLKRCNCIKLDMSMPVANSSFTPTVTITAINNGNPPTNLWTRSFELTADTNANTSRMVKQLRRLNKYREQSYELVFTNIREAYLYGMSFDLDIGTD